MLLCCLVHAHLYLYVIFVHIIYMNANFSVAFSWFFVVSLPQPAAFVGGCLEGNVQFLYIVEFNDSHFSSDETASTNYTLTNVPQEAVVEITISPNLPSLGITGPPLSQTVNSGKSYELLHALLLTSSMYYFLLLPCTAFHIFHVLLFTSSMCCFFFHRNNSKSIRYLRILNTPSNCSANQQVSRAVIPTCFEFRVSYEWRVMA